MLDRKERLQQKLFPHPILTTEVVCGLPWNTAIGAVLQSIRPFNQIIAYFWKIEKSSFSVSKRVARQGVMFPKQAKVFCTVFLLSWIFCVTGVESEAPYYKFPIYWKRLNNSEFESIYGRKLHDYLSLFPTYGDSKKIG